MNPHNGSACGLSGNCIHTTCHSNECTRIGLKQCPCPKSIERSECITCCLDDESGCLPSKELTTNLIQNNTELFQKLSKESKTDQAISNYRSSKICVGEQCMNLFFRSFASGDYCVYKGQLGICLKKFVCYVPSKRQQYPTIRRITDTASTSSGLNGQFSIYCLLNVTKYVLFVSLCYSFVIFFR